MANLALYRISLWDAVIQILGGLQSCDYEYEYGYPKLGYPSVSLWTVCDSCVQKRIAPVVSNSHLQVYQHFRLAKPNRCHWLCSNTTIFWAFFIFLPFCVSSVKEVNSASLMSVCMCVRVCVCVCVCEGRGEGMGRGCSPWHSWDCEAVFILSVLAWVAQLQTHMTPFPWLLRAQTRTKQLGKICLYLISISKTE